LLSITVLEKEAIKYFISKIIPGIFGFLSVLLFIRIIGNQQYGCYVLIFAIVNTMSVFFSGWYCQALLRYYGFYTSNINILKKIFIIVIFISITGGIVIMLLLGRYKILNFKVMINYKEEIPFLSIFSLFLLIIIYNIRLTLFQSQIRPNYVVSLEFLKSMLGLTIPLLFFLIIGKNYLSIIIGLSIAYGFTLFWPKYWFTNIREDNYIINKDDLEFKKSIILFLKYGWPLSFWFLCTNMFQVTDRYLIQYYYTFNEVGAYAALYDIVIRLYSLLLFPITLAAHPRIMNSWNSKKYNESFKVLIRAIIIQFLVFIPIICICVIGRDFLLNKMFPNIEKSFYSLLVPLTISGFLWQLALLIHKPLEIAEKTLWILLAIIISLMINIAGNYYFLPIYGVIASAYTTVFVSFVYLSTCILLFIKLKKRLINNKD
jgi:O-antigen/teichoic acid export membrane protein